MGLMPAPIRMPAFASNCGGTGGAGSKELRLPEPLRPAFGPAGSCSDRFVAPPHENGRDQVATRKIDTMRRLLGAVSLGLALAGGDINANASVPLPLVEQASPSLAPLLKQ